VVAGCDRDHFLPSDLPLLVRYVEAAALGDQAAEQLRLGAVINGKASPWITIQEKTVRAMVALRANTFGYQSSKKKSCAWYSTPTMHPKSRDRWRLIWRPAPICAPF
jgi:hypothetical protein